MTNQVKFSFPSAAVILMSVAFIAYAASLFVTPGSFELADGQQAVQLSDFKYATEHTTAPIFAQGGEPGFLNVLFEGLTSGNKFGATIGVMAFILITGGAFGILMNTGAINRAILRAIGRTAHLSWLFLPFTFVMFSLGGAIFGMGEEAIAFCAVLLPIMHKLGYDAKVTVLVTYVATQIGFASSWMNPFSIAIAQSIAEIPLFSGAPLRMVTWVLFTLFGLIFCLRYAKRIQKTTNIEQDIDDTGKLSSADKLILISFLATIVWVIWGVMARQYYIPELAAQFFTLGLVVAIIDRLFNGRSFSDNAEAFTKGAQELLPAALLVAMAKGIVGLLGGSELAQPSVLNTLLFHSASVLTIIPDFLAAWGMLVFQSVFNFFVSSGSGQAAITMPLMAPLGDLLSVTRQTVVLAFQLGDGLTNIIIPTSASLIGCLGVVKLDWGDWFKFIWRFQLGLFSLASAVVLFAHFSHYQ